MWCETPVLDIPDDTNTIVLADKYITSEKILKLNDNYIKNIKINRKSNNNYI